MKMTKEEKLNLYKFQRAQVEADFNANGQCSPIDARNLVTYFHDVLEAYGINLQAFVNELNERFSRLYCIRKESTGKERIYIYFKDCFYLLVDENMNNLLIEKVG